jgi:hypothetical protein
MDPSLIDVRRWMTRYIMSLFLGFGLAGNLISIYVFVRKDFLKNSCCLYLFAGAILNLLTVSWGISPAIYILDNTDPGTYSFIYCKLRLYTIHTPLMIGRTFMVLACVDRYALCSGSHRLRSFSQPKVAIRCIIATILIWPLLTIHIAILQNFSNSKCSMIGSYVLIYGIYASVASGICPPTLMSIFSVLAIRHRRELQTRLNTRRKGSKRDHALMVMLLSEVLVYVITTFLYPTITLYLAITSQQTKNPERVQIESFLNFLGGSFLVYLNPAAAFYVYLAVSHSFRKELKQAFIHRYRQITGRNNRVEPTGTQINDTRLVRRTTYI